MPSSTRAPWLVVGQGAAALAAAMGVGRFVYTPILPLMQAQAGMSPQLGSAVATANYLGYLVGAVAGIAVPALIRSVVVLRGSLIALVASLALMPLTQDAIAWLALRAVAGVASALAFMVVASAVLARFRGPTGHLTGWAFGGVGVGIAASGLLVLVLREIASWRVAWWTAALLAAVLTAAAWAARPEPAPAPDVAVRPPTVGRAWFAALFAAYFLEGVGYIVAGTFLVAAVDQGLPGWVGTGAWVVVGLAAIPSAALWTRWGRRRAKPALLMVALLVQAVGVALPAVAAGVAPALVSAVLFGVTFIGIAALALAIGADVGVPRSVALLTAGYSVGQILGPVAVTPLLDQGYRPALLVGAAVVFAAALCAVPIAVRPSPDPEPARAGRRRLAEEARRERGTSD